MGNSGKIWEDVRCAAVFRIIKNRLNIGHKKCRMIPALFSVLNPTLDPFEL